MHLSLLIHSNVVHFVLLETRHTVSCVGAQTFPLGWMRLNMLLTFTTLVVRASHLLPRSLLIS